MSILARLAQLQGLTIEGIPADEVISPEVVDRTQVRPVVSPPRFDFAPSQTVEEVVAASEGAAERAGEVPVPPPGETGGIIPPEEPPTGEGDPLAEERRRLEEERRRLEEERNRLALEFQGVDAPPPPPPPGTIEIPGDPVEEFDAKEYARLNYSWLGDDLIDTFLQEFNTNGGDEEEALRNLRTTQAYKDKFPGIFREDGTTLRIDTDTPELDYIKIREDYGNLLQDYNLNPEYFEGQIETLFENDVAPRVFEQRLNVAYNSLFPQFDAVKQYYVNNYPNIFPSTEDITDEAIFASFISEDVSSDIIEQRVNVSQIGGAFLEQDFAISQEQAQRLVSAGLSGTGAQQLAARAETQLPRLQRLARRFTGREDIFGLSEFIESEVFGEGVADQVRERLEAEQATVFTREGGAAVTQAGVTGLVEQ